MKLEELIKEIGIEQVHNLFLEYYLTLLGKEIEIEKIFKDFEIEDIMN